MPRYLLKNQKIDEKKHISTRIRSHVFEAFQNASDDAKLNGYTLTLSSVIEEALKHAINEYKEATGTDFLKLEIDKLDQEWFKEQEEDYKKEQAISFQEKVEFDDQNLKDMESDLTKEFDNQRKIQDKKDAELLQSLNPEEAKKFKLKRKKENIAQDKKNLQTIEDTKNKVKLINKLFEEKTKKHVNLFSSSDDYLKVIKELVKDANIKELNDVFKDKL